MRVVVLVIILSLAGFFLILLNGHPHKPVAQVVAQPIPMAVAKDTFKTCAWEKVSGARIAIWSFHCGADFGATHLVRDDKVGGFDIAGAPGEQPSMVIRTFPKPAGAPIEAALSAIRAASPGKDTATCALVPVSGFDAWPKAKLYDLEPTGAAKAAYDKANAIEPQPNPCGDLGIGPAGDRFFTILPGDPSRVVYVDMGSEIQVFDPNTLKAE
ncbi:MAG: hypothetical protein ACXU8U_03110 [Asticcacaulis sp.]